MELIKILLQWEDRMRWIPTFVTLIPLQGGFLSKTRITGLHSGSGIFSFKLKLSESTGQRSKIKQRFHKAVREDIFSLDGNLLISPMQTYYKRYACLLKTYCPFKLYCKQRLKEHCFQVTFFLIFISNSGLVCSESLLWQES